MNAVPRVRLSLAVCAGGALLALAGCAVGTPDARAGSPAPSAASTTPPATGTPTPTTTSPSARATGSPTPSSASPATAPHTGWLTDQVSGLPADPVLEFGGPPATFTVTLRNGSDSTYPNISPLVAIGHCSCNDSGAAPAPDGTLEELEPSTGNWRPVDYDTEGTGMDFLLSAPLQQPPITLAPGAVASFTFRLAISPIADQPAGEHAGTTSINVRIVTAHSRTQIVRDLFVPISVSVGTS